MFLINKIYLFVHETFSSDHLRDCQKGNIYEKSASYRHNRNERPKLLKRIFNSLFLVLFLYFLGFIGENFKYMWLYLPSYIAMTISFLQIPVLGYAYIYLSKWTQWNSHI